MKRFLKSAFLISAGGALPLLSSIVLLIPYTQNLNTSDYGALAIYISFSMLMQIIMNYGIDTYLSVHYFDHHHDTESLRKFLRKVMGMLLVIGAIVIVIFSIFGYFLFSWVFKGSTIQFFPYGIMSVLTAFFNGFFRTYSNIQVFADKPVKYFFMGAFNFVVTVVISTILVYQYPYSLIGPMWGRLISGILIFLLSLVFVLKEFGISWDITIIPAIRKYCTPILFFGLLTWVLSYINNYIINAFETTTEVGVYDFAIKCTLLIEYAGYGILGTINPRIFRYWKEKNINQSTPEENRYHHVYSGFNILFIALNIIALPIIIRLFVTNEGYYDSINFIPILCVSFIFRGLNNMFINPIYFFKKTKKLPGILLVTAIIQIATGLAFTYNWGIEGAVWSYFLVKPIQVFFMWFGSKSIFNFRFNTVKMIIMPLVYAGSVILIWLLVDLSEFGKGLLQLGIAGILVALVYRKELMELPNILRSRLIKK